MTVQLQQSIEALRVASHRLALVGNWFAIVDFVHTRSDYAANRALPIPLRYVARCTSMAGNDPQCGTVSTTVWTPGRWGTSRIH